MMKKFFLLLTIVLTCHFLMAQYKAVDNGSSVQFKIKNFGINTGGSFTGLQGNIRFDPAHLDNALFDVSINAGSVNTGNDMRDNHLRGESYFDVKKYPVIHFVSTRVTPPVNDGTFMISGKLTIKDHTKDISFPFTAAPTSDGYIFKGTFMINRKDFEVGGTSTISNSLEVQLSVVGKK